MTPPKVYLPSDYAPGYQSFDPRDVDQSLFYKVSSDVGKRRLAQDWPAVKIFFDTSRKRDRLRPDLGLDASTIAMRAHHVEAMHLYEGPEIELLPITVDDEQWVLINPTHALRAYDERTSEARLLHPVAFPIIVAFNWVNIQDPHVLDVELFKLPGGRGQTMVTQSFVDRVQQLGLKGLVFRHIGYVVPDASQAISKPPDPPAPTPVRRSAAKRTVTKLAPLNRSELRDLDAVRAKATGTPASASPESVLAWLKSQVDAARPGFDALDDDAQIDLFMRWMVPFGDLLRDQLGWTWCALTHGRDLRWTAIANPAGTCAVALAPLLRRQALTDDWTLPLLWNMLRAGSQPTAPAGEVAVIQ